jgi:hypothetical protein
VTWRPRSRPGESLNSSRDANIRDDHDLRWHALATALNVDPSSVISATEQPRTGYNLARRLLGVLRGLGAECMKDGLGRADMAALIPRFRTMDGWWENAKEAVEATEKRRRTENGRRGPGNECLVCLERERTVALNPCNHLAVCDQCAKAIGTCPYCGRPIESRAYLFVP